jgi:hypothetical protein
VTDAFADRPGLVRPAHFHIPDYVKTFGPEVADLCDLADYPPDAEQRLALDMIFARRADGLSAVFEGAIIVGRQNIKSSSFKMAALGWLYLFDERLVVYSAHEFGDLDLDTPMFTANRGWTTMGGLAPGDEVFGPDGQPTKVTIAHPIQVTSDCYRVSFADGQSLVAGAQHLWQVTEIGPWAYWRAERVVSTREMHAAGVAHVSPPNGRRRTRARRVWRWRVDLPKPPRLPDAELPVDPWLFGAWLGDGTRNKNQITAGAAELPYILNRIDRLGETYRLVPDPRWPDRVTDVFVYGLVPRLRRTGALTDKRIPEMYLRASEAQRRELLAGIMDTDGTVSAHQLAVTMVRPDLMEDILCLVRSLGYRATLRRFKVGQGTYRNSGAFKWRVQFAPDEGSPFGMPRKSSAIKRLRKTRSAYNAIVAIEPVLTRPTRCLTVAHESGCFLAGRGFIPTHNTAMEMFRDCEQLVTGSDYLRREVKRVIRNHGEEAIELKSGARLIFKTRTSGGGRGLSGRKVILDEGFALKPKHMGALVPTMSAQPDPQLLYGSSAALEDSDVLRDVVARGRAGDTPRLGYLEWCAPPPEEACEAGGKCTHAKTAVGCGCDKPDLWLKANPAIGKRITIDYIAAERQALPVSEFRRERMGWHDHPTDGTSPMPLSSWLACADPQSAVRAGSPLAVAIDVAPDSSMAAIAVAGWRDDDLPHGELAEHLPGTGWLMDRLLGICGRRHPCVVALDPAGPAGAFEKHLRNAGFVTAAPDKPTPLGAQRLHLLSARDYAQACGALANAAANGAFRHPDQKPLNDAAEAARSRNVAQAWAWDSTGADITPLVSVTLAIQGLSVFGKKTPPAPFLLTGGPE